MAPEEVDRPDGPWHVEEACLQDLDRIMDGNSSLAKELGYELRRGEAVAHADRRLRDRDPDRRARYLVVRGEDGEVIGFCFLVAADTDFCPPLRWWVETLFVFEEHRQRGIARALIDACERIVLAADADRLFLHCELRNRGALPAYFSQEFFATGDLMMCKELVAACV
jgi:GNAT superfamily N-acetyltransferase